jgi:hypothetical protein
MAREIGRLSAVKVRNAPSGMHGDGGGLWLHVNAAGARPYMTDAISAPGFDPWGTRPSAYLRGLAGGGFSVTPGRRGS